MTPNLDNFAGNSTAESLLAVFIDQIGQSPLGKLFQQLPSRFPLSLVKSQIKRPGSIEGEPASRIGQLIAG